MSASLVPNVGDTQGTAVRTSIEGPNLSHSANAHASAVVSAVKAHIPSLTDSQTNGHASTSPDAEAYQPKASADAYAPTTQHEAEVQKNTSEGPAATAASEAPVDEKELEREKRALEKAKLKEQKIEAQRKEKEDKLKAKAEARHKKEEAKRNKDQNALQALLSKQTNAKAESDAKRLKLEEQIKQLEGQAQKTESTPSAKASTASAAALPAATTVAATTADPPSSAKAEQASVPTVSKASLTALSHQVAGHEAGVFTTANGSLVIKPCLPLESEFYQNVLVNQPKVSKSQRALLQRLSRYLPTFHGTLDIVEEGASPTRAVILENLTHGYKHANVLDIKLGKQLWDESASAEKRARMDAQSKSTTSGKTGVRLTGWQVWDDEKNAVVKVDKTFGKSIEADQLDLGLRSFFGLGSDADAKAISDISGNTVNSVQLPSKSVQRILNEAVLPAVKDISDIVKKLEWRVRGGSLLIIYEGDAEVLEKETVRSFPVSGRSSKQSDKIVDASKLDSLSATAGPRRVVDVRLIDFAHATLTPGKGHDDGYLTGVATTRTLVEKLAKDARKGKVGKASTKSASLPKAKSPVNESQVDKDKAAKPVDSPKDASAPVPPATTNEESKPVTKAEQALTNAPIVAAAAIPLAATAGDGDADKNASTSAHQDGKKDEGVQAESSAPLIAAKTNANDKKEAITTKKLDSDDKAKEAAAESKSSEKSGIFASLFSRKDSKKAKKVDTSEAAPALPAAVALPSQANAQTTTSDASDPKVDEKGIEAEKAAAVSGLGATIGAGSILLANEDNAKDEDRPTDASKTTSSALPTAADAPEKGTASSSDQIVTSPTDKAEEPAPRLDENFPKQEDEVNDKEAVTAASAAAAGTAGAAAILASSNDDEAEKAKAKVEDERKEAEEKAEKERKAAEKKAEEERKAAEKKVEEERKAAEKKADEERKAAEKKAEEERKAAEKKAEEERKAAEKKAEEERKAAAKKAEEERKAVEKKAEEDRKAAEEEKRAAEKKAADEAKAAEKRAAEEKKAAEKKAAEERKKAETEAAAAAAAAAALAAEQKKAQEKEAKEAKRAEKAQQKEAKKAAKEARKDGSEATSEKRKSRISSLFATPLGAAADKEKTNKEAKGDSLSHPSVSGTPAGGDISAHALHEVQKSEHSNHEEKSRGGLASLLTPLAKRETSEAHEKGPSFSASPAGAEETVNESAREEAQLDRKASKRFGLTGVFGGESKKGEDDKEAAKAAPVADIQASTNVSHAPETPTKPGESPTKFKSHENEGAPKAAEGALAGAAVALPATAVAAASTADDDEKPATPAKDDAATSTEASNAGFFGALMRRKSQKAKTATSPSLSSEKDGAAVHADAQKAHEAALQAKAEAEKARKEAKKAREEAERAHAEVEKAKAERAKAEKEKAQAKAVVANEEKHGKRKSGFGLLGFGKKAGESKTLPEAPSAAEEGKNEGLDSAEATPKSAAEDKGFIVLSGSKGSSTDGSALDSQIPPEILAAIEMGERKDGKQEHDPVSPTPAAAAKNVKEDKQVNVEQTSTKAAESKSGKSAAGPPPVPAKESTPSSSSSPKASTSADPPAREKQLGRIASLLRGKGGAGQSSNESASSTSGQKKAHQKEQQGHPGAIFEEVVEDTEHGPRKFIRVTNPPRGAGRAPSAVQWRDP